MGIFAQSSPAAGLNSVGPTDGRLTGLSQFGQTGAFAPPQFSDTL